MKGLYLYCIREKANSSFFTKGINGGRVFVVPYQDLEAVVSKVSLEKFGSKEIQKKAQEDLKWIKEKAQVHDRIIRQAMKKKDDIVSVIPMKFGTIFESKEKLEESLKRHCFEFKKTLKGLTGKQEWGVKVYLDKKFFEKAIREESKVIQGKEKEIITFPEGAAYFMQKQLDETVSKMADEVLQQYEANIFKNIKKHTEAGIKGKILEKEFTGKVLPMVFNASFIVSEKKLVNFVKEINKLNQEYRPKGFNCEYSGPWPPYNFV